MELATYLSVRFRSIGLQTPLQRQRTIQSMADFRPGDMVRFQTDEREITGVLIRLNKKSVTVHTENGNRWNVAPQLLTLVKRPLTLETQDSILEQNSNQGLH